jgi:purine-binding chemotaxis protein CheW
LVTAEKIRERKMATCETGAAQLKSAKNGRGEADLAEKFLTFELAEEEYGIEILKVREIIGLLSITPVPRTPAYVRGVINLRGKVIPVVDLKLKFGMNRSEDTRETCIIVVEVTHADDKILTGILVDRVREVLDIKSENIEDAPEMGEGVETDFIKGMGKTGDRVSILLDIDGVLNSGEMELLRKSGTS